MLRLMEVRELQTMLSMFQMMKPVTKMTGSKSAKLRSETRLAVIELTGSPSTQLEYLFLDSWI